MESSWLLGSWIVLNILNNFFCNKCAFRSGEFVSFPHAKETHLPFFSLNYFSHWEKTAQKLALLVDLSSKSVYLWECIFFLFSHCDYFVLQFIFQQQSFPSVLFELLIMAVMFSSSVGFLRSVLPFSSQLLCHLNFELLVLLISSY